ncbi:MAG: hypothetical protein RSA94_01875 [Mucinivorans sp.]
MTNNRTSKTTYTKTGRKVNGYAIYEVILMGPKNRATNDHITINPRPIHL